jgi:hypothetical protein
MRPLRMDSSPMVGMTASTDVLTAHKWAGRIEEAEASRRGERVVDVRPSVARRLGTLPGTLENLSRLRLKSVPNWLMARIRAEFVAVLQSEIVRLEHEITIARQTGVDHRDDALVAAEAQVEAAKAILKL